MRSVSASACPEPRGATLSRPNGSGAGLSEAQAEGEVVLAGERRAGEVLLEVRDGRVPEEIREEVEVRSSSLEVVVVVGAEG